MTTAANLLAKILSPGGYLGFSGPISASRIWDQAAPSRIEESWWPQRNNDGLSCASLSEPRETTRAGMEYVGEWLEKMRQLQMSNNCGGKSSTKGNYWPQVGKTDESRSGFNNMTNHREEHSPWRNPGASAGRSSSGNTFSGFGSGIPTSDSPIAGNVANENTVNVSIRGSYGASVGRRVTFDLHPDDDEVLSSNWRYDEVVGTITVVKVEVVAPTPLKMVRPLFMEADFIVHNDEPQRSQGLIGDVPSVIILESTRFEDRMEEVVSVLVEEAAEGGNEEGHMRPALAQDLVVVVPSPTISESEMMIASMVRTVAALMDDDDNNDDNTSAICSTRPGVEGAADYQVRPAVVPTNASSVGVVLPTPLEVAAVMQTMVADSHYRGVNSWTNVILGGFGGGLF